MRYRKYAKTIRNNRKMQKKCHKNKMPIRFSRKRKGLSKKYPVTRVLPSYGMKQAALDKLGLPEKPKKPPTAFFKFLMQIRPTIVQENPNVKVTEIGKIAAQKWEKIDPKIKSELDLEYKRQMEIYNAAKLKYEENLTSEQKIDLKEAKMLEIESKEKKRHKKKIRDLGRPKKPTTSFIKYTLERLPARGHTPMNEWQKKMSKEWEALSIDIKAKYIEEVKRDTIKYQQDLKRWEEEMIKLGHVDVVRTEALLPKSKMNK